MRGGGNTSEERKRDAREGKVGLTGLRDRSEKGDEGGRRAKVEESKDRRNANGTRAERMKSRLRIGEKE